MSCDASCDCSYIPLHNSKKKRKINKKRKSKQIVSIQVYYDKDVHLEASWDHAVLVKMPSSVVVFYWFFQDKDVSEWG